MHGFVLGLILCGDLYWDFAILGKNMGIILGTYFGTLNNFQMFFKIAKLMSFRCLLRLDSGFLQKWSSKNLQLYSLSEVCEKRGLFQNDYPSFKNDWSFEEQDLILCHEKWNLGPQYTKVSFLVIHVAFPALHGINVPSPKNFSKGLWQSSFKSIRIIKGFWSAC